MRQGNSQLRIKRYRMRRRRRAALLFLLLGVLALCAYVARPLWLPAVQVWIPSPAPTLSPEESARTEAEYTLSGQTWYTLQLGVFESEQSAAQLAADYRQRGAAGYVHVTEGGYKVLAAAYDKRADALIVQGNLLDYHGVEAFVTEVTVPEVVLHLSGQKAQVEALSSVYDYVTALCGEMYAFSLQLDQGTAGRDDLTDALKSHLQTADALHDRLVAVFGAGENAHAAAAQLQQLLQSLSAAMENALAETSSARFGGAVKLCQLTAVCGLCDHARGLEATTV